MEQKSQVPQFETYTENKYPRYDYKERSTTPDYSVNMTRPAAATADMPHSTTFDFQNYNKTTNKYKELLDTKQKEIHAFRSTFTGGRDLKEDYYSRYPRRA